MRFEDVAARIEGIPFMSPELGRRVYDHIRASRPEAVLGNAPRTAKGFFAVPKVVE